MHKLLLASKSPRRKEILSQRGYKFDTFPIEVSEILSKNLNLNEQISQLAKEKALAAASQLKSLISQDILILSADTVVVLDQEILGKPKDFSEAVETLTRLSGRQHLVITGYCFLDLKPHRLVLGQSSSKVEFRNLSLDEIKAYVQTNDPMDKAGSYGIQGEARKFVKNFSGSFENIVGLPIEEIEKVMDENDWRIEKKS